MAALKRVMWPTVWMLAALALMLGLGAWQMQRKAWKEGLIARIEARVKAEPVSLDEAIWQLQSTGDIEYLRVRVRGTFRHDKEMNLYAPEGGSGWQIFTPMQVPHLGALIVDRGFVPDAFRAPESRKAGLIAGETEVIGLARVPGVKGAFVPPNEPAKNIWYWRDLQAMLAAEQGAVRGGDRPWVPFFLDAQAEPANPGGWPKGGTTLVSLPNRHLEYAVTWYGLALALLGVYAVFVRGRLKDKPED